MTLYFVGIGIAGADKMGPGARGAIASARRVYMERFTSPVPDAELDEVRRIAEEGGAAFKAAARWMVEDGGEILREARGGDVALVCYGDPYMATTHIELRVRAIAEGIRTQSVHAASALTGIVGECGLHQYKVGRTSTVTRHEASTPYDILDENVERGCHTVLLLEYDQDSGTFLDPREALKGLLKIEAEARRGAATKDTFAIIASRIGRDNQGIKAGRIASLLEADAGAPPHSIIVPGSMHFTETDAVSALAECLDEPRANSDAARTEPHRMVSKYAPMIAAAVAEERRRATGEGAARVLEGAESYAADAQEFLRNGRGALAILSIGYADGLVDALRIIGGRPYRGGAGGGGP